MSRRVILAVIALKAELNFPRLANLPELNGVQGFLTPRNKTSRAHIGRSFGLWRDGHVLGGRRVVWQVIFPVAAVP
jgi:hypothetical protein